MVQALGSGPNKKSVLFDYDHGANLDPVEEINYLSIHHPNATR